MVVLQKQAVDISFAQGIDTKTDPKRVQMGKFAELENSVFNKGGLLQKRNGYPKLSELPDTSYSYLTTFNGNLTAIGQNIAAYNSANASWVSKGMIEPLSLTSLSLIRNNLNQTACDSAVAANGLVCTVYLESDGTTTTNKYVIADSITGQNIIAPTVIPVASGTVSGGMRVFILNTYFIIVFTNTITGTPHLQYIAVSSNQPTVVIANTDIASSYAPATTLAFDGYVAGSKLFIAYNTTSGGQSVKVTSLSSSFVVASAVTFAAQIATMMSVTADLTSPSNPIIYVNYYDAASTDGHSLSVDQNLNTLHAPAQIITTKTVLNITAAASAGSCKVFYEVSNNYTWASIASNYIESVTITGASVSAPAIIIRSVGLASKAEYIDSDIYFLAAFQSSYQPTYFLINGSSSTQASPIIAAKLAYSNGGGYLTKGLPALTVIGSVAYAAYLFKDLIQAVNKDTNVPTGTQVNGIYSQTGINLASFEIGTSRLYTSEVGGDLNITGGFLSMYDGYLPVEQNFFLWPDTDQSTPANNATWSATGGSIVAKPDAATNTNAYYYQITYEWSDNQGNAFRSAPSLPIPVTTTGSGSAGSIVIKGPTLRLTMKTANPVKIVIYRWSVGQQNYFQVTSISAPLLNSTTVDNFTFTDTLADSSILGNNLIYTTGGVVENVNAPGSNILALFDNRQWLVDAENPNLLWFSKQVIQGTPAEMSDLFTVYVPPTTATQGSTGPIKSLAPMDDKLIIGKKNAFLYINGKGPDNTGANNQYSEPIFVTATVGCENQRSLVLIPQGLMFQSDKGIWLLGRDLASSYIGAPVEDFVLGANVVSAVTVPETNQVRFVMDSGITLVYDYFYGQWSTFTGVPALSSCIFEDMHTFINDAGEAYQERAGTYLDGSRPVLMSFKTGPLRLGDLQGYQRAYFFYLLGTYYSPHQLRVNLFYDYEPNVSQSVLINPINYSTPFGSGGSQSPFGEQTPFGGPSSLEDWSVYFERQRCMAFAIQIKEIFDPSFATVAGEGLDLSGLQIVMGMKKGYRPQANVISAG